MGVMYYPHANECKEMQLTVKYNETRWEDHGVEFYVHVSAINLAVRRSSY